MGKIQGTGYPAEHPLVVTCHCSTHGNSKRRGANLRRVALRDVSHKMIGWYIYYLKPGDRGQVLQLGGQREFIKNILEHLFHDAWSHGAIGLHGVVPSHLMGDFSEKSCFFTCRGGWNVAHSRKPELLELLGHGDASLSRLDGDSCLNFGD